MLRKWARFLVCRGERDGAPKRRIYMGCATDALTQVPSGQAPALDGVVRVFTRPARPSGEGLVSGGALRRKHSQRVRQGNALTLLSGGTGMRHAEGRHSRPSAEKDRLQRSCNILQTALKIIRGLCRQV